MQVIQRQTNTYCGGRLGLRGIGSEEKRGFGGTPKEISNSMSAYPAAFILYRVIFRGVPIKSQEVLIYLVEKPANFLVPIESQEVLIYLVEKPANFLLSKSPNLQFQMYFHYTMRKFF